MKTVQEWAKEKGQVNTRIRSIEHDTFSVAHSVAAVRHGWNWYEKHYGSVELEEVDYLEALAFAGIGEVHEPANRRNGPVAEKE